MDGWMLCFGFNLETYKPGKRESSQPEIIE
jgi:hypothetical protein